MGHFFGSSFFGKKLSPEFLERLIGFLAYKEPKLWLKNQKLGKAFTPINAGPGYIISMAITGHNSSVD